MGVALVLSGLTVLVRFPAPFPSPGPVAPAPWSTLYYIGSAQERFEWDGSRCWHSFTFSGAVTLSDSLPFSYEVRDASGSSVLAGTWPGMDRNTDGFIDGIDYDSFHNDFAAGHPRADFNLDGFVDGIDFDLFSLAWSREVAVQQ